MNESSLSVADIKDAAVRIRGYVRNTPFLESDLLNDLLKMYVCVKAEVLQTTGSFKVRGAFNQLLSLKEKEKKKGVVAFSSGNHAQAVAYAARSLHIPAIIVMPEDAPALKLANTRAYGAEVITYNRYTESREALGEELAELSGGVLIHPYNDIRTIAGQGTVGLELVQPLKAMAAEQNVIVVPCSGGGLASGIATAVQGAFHEPPQLFVAEPRDYNDAGQSLNTGQLASNSSNAPAACDALMAPSLGERSFGLLRQYGAKGLTASNDYVYVAMYLLAHYFKLVVEPSGAMALACALRHRKTFRDAAVVTIASGGNADPGKYTAMLARGRKLAPQLFGVDCG